jgi:glutamate racemase
MNLGMFDFGIGGLTVMKQLLSKNLCSSLIFLSDNIPLGKDHKHIKKRIINNVEFLESKGVKNLIFACNTATAVAFKEAVFKFPQLELYNVVDAGAKSAIEKSKNNRIGIIGTALTINSKIYIEKIKTLNEKAVIYQKSLEKLASMIERDCHEKELIEYLEENLKFFNDKGIDTLILGCTHYPIVSNYIKEILQKVTIIDPARKLADEISNRCEIDFSKSNIDVDISVYTYNIAKLYKMTKMILGERIADEIKFYELNEY